MSILGNIYLFNIQVFTVFENYQRLTYKYIIHTNNYSLLNTIINYL